MTTATYIQRKPPNDGSEYDCQCARCGSTLAFEDCCECDGNGRLGPDDFDYNEFDPDVWDGQACASCDGAGAFPVCISGEQWCKDHPAPGREQVEPMTPEWFAVARTAKEGQE